MCLCNESKDKKRYIRRSYYIIITCIAEQMKILATRANFYKFKTYPISFWVYSFITFSIAVYLTYFLYSIAKKGEQDDI